LWAPGRAEAAQMGAQTGPAGMSLQGGQQG
jgi:hypothetical protein